MYIRGLYWFTSGYAPETIRHSKFAAISLTPYFRHIPDWWLAQSRVIMDQNYKTWELRHIHPYTHFREWCLHEWTSKATQVHTPCSLGRTPLHSAAESGHLEVGVARFQHKGRRGLQGTPNSKPSACLHACNVWWGIFWGNQLAKQTDMTWIGYHNSEFSATLPAMALLMMIECL